MSFSVTVLGCGGMFPTVERAASGYLVEVGDAKVWMDAGPGTWRNLMRHLKYPDIDGIVLSHRHPDHTSDVFMAYHSRRYGQTDALPLVPLWAPAETIDRINDFVPGLEEAFDFHPVDESDSFNLGGAAFSFAKMAHADIVTLGIRVEHDGAVLGYTADTGLAADFESLAKGADLFLCEATYQDSDIPGWEGHLSATQAAETAVHLGARELVLTHLPHARDLELSLQQAKTASGDISVRLAYDGLKMEVKS